MVLGAANTHGFGLLWAKQTLRSQLDKGWMHLQQSILQANSRWWPRESTTLPSVGKMMGCTDIQSPVRLIPPRSWSKFWAVDVLSSCVSGAVFCVAGIPAVWSWGFLFHPHPLMPSWQKGTIVLGYKWQNAWLTMPKQGHLPCGRRSGLEARGSWNGVNMDLCDSIFEIFVLFCFLTLHKQPDHTQNRKSMSQGYITL